MKVLLLTTVVFRFVDRWLPIRRSLPVGLWSVKWRAYLYTLLNNFVFMRKSAIWGILIWMFVACESAQKEADSLERIPINVDDVAEDASAFLEKIEIVPLETNDSVLFDTPSIVFYDKGADMYVLMSDMDVFTFSGDGKSIGSSVKKRGPGPEEYQLVVDMKFNHFLHGIDLLTPYGTIYTYSPTFELLARRAFKPEFPLSYMMPLDSCNYVFKYASLWVDQEVGFVNLQTGDIHLATYTGMISSGNGLNHPHFHRIGDDFYFIPQGVDYYIYRMDTLRKEVFPVMYLDFGAAEIKDNELPGRASGKRVDNDKDRMNVANESAERRNFLNESTEYVVPMQKIFNGKYVYICMRKGQEMWHYVYDRSKEKGYLLKNEKPLRMYPCFGLDGNVLLAVCQPMELPLVVDRRFMSPEQVAMMEGLKEDDNPVILKYYLKQ